MHFEFTACCLSLQCQSLPIDTFVIGPSLCNDMYSTKDSKPQVGCPSFTIVPATVDIPYTKSEALDQLACHLYKALYFFQTITHKCLTYIFWKLKIMFYQYFLTILYYYLIKFADNSILMSCQYFQQIILMSYECF